jgi:queuine tRNA-ribosyltransferase
VGGSLGKDKEEIARVVAWSLRETPEERPRHLLGIGDVDDILDAVAAGIDSFDCATPTRLGRHGTALVPEPATRWRLDLTKTAARGVREPIWPGCPCPACEAGHSRGYLHYLARGKELTGARLITLHNLVFMAELMRGIRAGVADGSFDAYRERVLKGEQPL